MNAKRIFLLCILLILLVACASQESASYDTSRPGEMEYATAVEQASPPIDVSGANDDSQSFQTSGQTVARLIIRTADIELVVKSTEDAMEQISRFAEQSEGWVVSTNSWAYRDNTQAGSITIRIPATGFNSALESLKAMAVRVERVSSSGQDVTEEYIDLESRLANLEATAVRVRAFLDEAKNVEEALDVNQELSRLEGEIEVLKGRIHYLSQSAAYSTITVSLTPDIQAQPIQVAGWRPQGVAKEAVEALIGTLQGVADLLIWVAIYLLPVAIVVLLPTLLVGRWLWRKVRRNSPTKTNVPVATTAERENI